MGKRRFDPNIERVLYFGEEPAHLVLCPRCQTRLVVDYQTFLVATREGPNTKSEDAFLLGGDYGHFCPNCPTLVVNSKRLASSLAVAVQGPPSMEWIPLALVDMDSWPEDKRHLPLVEVENDLKKTFFLDRRHFSRPLGPVSPANLSEDERRQRRARRKREKRSRKR